MNTIWSTYIQRAEMLDQTRKLRFADCFQAQYQAVFDIPDNARILEIGCGTGALSRSLGRWYPNTDITGIDRDSTFVQFAASRAANLTYIEGDATALPFPDHSFDVTISNTVQEHIEPAAFFNEQRRVLRIGGICLVLSSCKTTTAAADCLKKRSDFEQAIYKKVNESFQQADHKYGVCAYPMTEAELPRAMASHGFRHVSTSYLAISLTPDHPTCSADFAEAIINAGRQEELDEIACYPDIAPGIVSELEQRKMKEYVNTRYDERIRLYRAGEKQWDTSIQLLMIVRGVK